MCCVSYSIDRSLARWLAGVERRGDGAPIIPQREGLARAPYDARIDDREAIAVAQVDRDEALVDADLRRCDGAAEALGRTELLERQRQTLAFADELGVGDIRHGL